MSLNTVSVRINGQNPTRVGSVSYGNLINVKVDNKQEHVVKSINLASGKLSELSDVSAQNPEDKDTLVYNASTLKYESRKIESSDINITNIDAGVF